MLLPHSFSTAFTLLIMGMIFWGSWPNSYRITQDWRLELFHLDFSIGMFLIAILAALTAGTYFSPHGFGQNFINSDHSAWLWTVGAGAFVNVGNLMLVAGIRKVGMAVAFPVAVGLSLVLGTFLSYWVIPKGDPLWLGLGVALIFSGVLTTSLAYRYRPEEENSSRRSISGLGICVISGILFTCAGPMVAKSLSSPRPLVPYGVCFLYGFGSLLAAPPLVLCFMRHPIEGGPISFADYSGGSLRNHAAGWLGGALCGGGMLFTFIPAGMVGMAIALAVGQADPLVAALWGIFLWREFHNSPARAHVLLVIMFFLYISGLIAIGHSYHKT